MTAAAQHSWFKRILLPGLALKAFVIGGGYATGRELAEFFLPAGPRGGLMAIALGALAPLSAFALFHIVTVFPLSWVTLTGRDQPVPSLRIAAGRTAAGVDFDALDGEPVRICFLLVGPESEAGAHVKALSRIARVVRRESVRERLTGAMDVDEFLRVLDQAEAA